MNWGKLAERGAAGESERRGREQETWTRIGRESRSQAPAFVHTRILSHSHALTNTNTYTDTRLFVRLSPVTVAVTVRSLRDAASDLVLP